MITTFKSLKWHPFLIAHKNYRKYDHENFSMSQVFVLDMFPQSILSVCAVEKVSTSHSFKLNSGPGLASKLFAMSQIQLVGLSKPEFHRAHRKLTLWTMNVKTAMCCQTHCTHIILQSEAQTFTWSDKKKNHSLDWRGEPLSYTFREFQEVIIVHLFHNI